jgi:hypothetical protein
MLYSMYFQSNLGSVWLLATILAAPMNFSSLWWLPPRIPHRYCHFGVLVSSFFVIHQDFFISGIKYKLCLLWCISGVHRSASVLNLDGFHNHTNFESQLLLSPGWVVVSDLHCIWRCLSVAWFVIYGGALGTYQNGVLRSEFTIEWNLLGLQVTCRRKSPW